MISPSTSALPSRLSAFLTLCFCVVMTMMLDQAHGFVAVPSLSSLSPSSFSSVTTVDNLNGPPTAARLIDDDCHHCHRLGHLALTASSQQENNDNSDDDDSSTIILSAKAKELLDKAEQLRQEIAALEDSKEQAKEAEREVLQEELNQQEAYLEHYSGIVPILKPDGSVVMEQVQFPPLIESSGTSDEENNDGFGSEILVCEASLPLGMILGQDTEDEQGAMIVVDEVLPDSNGALAGIQEGDVLRACTSCKVEMEQPTWQLLVGGIGRPKTMRFMLGTDDKPLELVMEALGANRMDPEARPVVLVVERPKKTEAAISE